MVKLGSGAEREIKDFRLSRYACYQIVQNGYPSKPVIANGQTYFAIQTLRQELKEDEQRLFLRNELREHNRQLVETAQQAGVETNLDFAWEQAVAKTTSLEKGKIASHRFPFLDDSGKPFPDWVEKRLG